MNQVSNVLSALPVQLDKIAYGVTAGYFVRNFAVNAGYRFAHLVTGKYAKEVDATWAHAKKSAAQEAAVTAGAVATIFFADYACETFLFNKEESTLEAEVNEEQAPTEAPAAPTQQPVEQKQEEPVKAPSQPATKKISQPKINQQKTPEQPQDEGYGIVNGLSILGNYGLDGVKGVLSYAYNNPLTAATIFVAQDVIRAKLFPARFYLNGVTPVTNLGSKTIELGKGGYKAAQAWLSKKDPGTDAGKGKGTGTDAGKGTGKGTGTGTGGTQPVVPFKLPKVLDFSKVADITKTDATKYLSADQIKLFDDKNINYKELDFTILVQNQDIDKISKADYQHHIAQLLK